MSQVNHKNVDQRDNQHSFPLSLFPSDSHSHVSTTVTPCYWWWPHAGPSGQGSCMGVLYTHKITPLVQNVYKRFVLVGMKRLQVAARQLKGVCSPVTIKPVLLIDRYWKTPEWHKLKQAQACKYDWRKCSARTYAPHAISKAVVHLFVSHSLQI